ncbi:MAG: hypothetical protein COB58_10625 [Thalassobium sp.]|nr:MAG: hypothetical protein COB58_14550 [Thalassobium sp.]PHQ84521.1 MAG: hypothetical protein COB58_10625 [Thalassobium sp.]
MKKLSLALALAVSSSFAFGGGSVGWNTVNQIAIQDGDVILYADAWSNPNSCEASNGVILRKSDENFDNAYAFVLSAFMAGKEVVGYSDGCKNFDGKSYNYIRAYKYLQMR